ncbi:MAG: FHA domain-containing protein [Candidatus Obscuribacterales bacterium]
MTTYNCSAGHNSVDPDFCSECGNQLAPLPGASSPAGAPAADPASAPPASSSTSAHEDCPMCTEVRDGSAQFCGVCGYDFVNKTGGEVPQAAAPAPAAPAPNYAPPAVPTPTVAAPTSLSSARIDVEVVVGKTGPRKHSLFDNENLIGRPNNKVALSLVIDGDEGISRRQMMVTRQADGTVTVRDLDSANGTKVEHDGGTVTLAVGEERPIIVGDKIIIGEHTVVTIIAIVI